MHHACMTVAPQIRDVPESTRDALAAEATRRRQSLQGVLLDMVTREAAVQANRRAFDAVADLRLSLPDGWSPEAVIRRGRDQDFASARPDAL